MKKFPALLKKLSARYKPERPPEVDAITQLVISFLQWETTYKLADKAFTRIMESVVDINELRVSHVSEIIAMIGEDYLLAEERVTRMRESLNEIFLRERSVVMNSIEQKGKRDQRAYLDSLPGIPAYVCAQVTLLVYGGHAIPVDNKLLSLLGREELVGSDADPQQVEAVLLRQVKAGNGLQAHLVLAAWCDASKKPAPAKTPTGASATAVSSKTTKKAAATKTKKKTNKKTGQTVVKRSKKK